MLLSFARLRGDRKQSSGERRAALLLSVCTPSAGPSCGHQDHKPPTIMVPGQRSRSRSLCVDKLAAVLRGSPAVPALSIQHAVGVVTSEVLLQGRRASAAA